MMNQSSITFNISLIPEQRQANNTRMQDQITAILGDAWPTKTTTSNHIIKHQTPTTALVAAPSLSLHHHIDNEMHNDDMATVSSSSSSSSVATQHMMSSLAEVDALLDDLVNAIHVQLEQEKLLDHCIEKQVQIAHGMRQVQGNQIGFILQMHKIHQTQTARERVNFAIQLLQDHVESIESQLEEQTQSIHPHNDDDMMMMMMEDVDEIICIDTTDQRNYAEQVNVILSAAL